MNTHHTKIKKKRTVARNTIEYILHRPSGFQFIAGQFVKVTLIHTPHTDPKVISRDFSLANAPHEEDLVISLRHRDTLFKQELQNLAETDELTIDGPHGKLVLHQDETRPAVFIAGGIGIASFRSIVLDALQQSKKHRLYIFSINPYPEDATYTEELQEYAKKHPQFTFVPVITREEAFDRWQGETGYITKEMLERYIDDVMQPSYYIVGPVKMVISAKRTLRSIGVPENQIEIEIYTGY